MHEKTADGKSALDFLRKMNNPDWHIITDKIEVIDGMTFMPYMTKPELEVEDDTSGTKKIMGGLKNGKFLFTHHAISDSMVRELSTNIFNEVVLPKNDLSKKFDMVFGGHIHTRQVLNKGKIYVAGSVFKAEVNEKDKSILKVDEDSLKVTQHNLPGRDIIRVENPSVEDLKKINKNTIVKVLITDKKIKSKFKSIKKELDRFTANVFVEQYPNERKKIEFKGELLDLSMEKLLEIYSKEKKVDVKKLMFAWDIIK